jgi:uncharacterized protein
MNNREIISSTYEAFAKGDVPGVLAGFAENIEWTEAEGFPYGGTYTGANAILENVFMKLAVEWENFSATPSELIDGGETIVALGIYSGKYRKTDKAVSVPFAHVWKLDSGKIVRFVQYTDTLLVARVL